MSIFSILIRVICIGWLILLGCSAGSKHNISISPEKINDGLKVASPLKFNTNISLLNSMIQGIESGDYVNIHSILIIKDGLLVVEVYFEGYERSTSHEIRSATKSIGSILTGIALDKRFVPSDDATVYDYFKDDYSPSYGWNTRTKQVNIGHLLSMTSGYDCDDLVTNFACEDAMYDTDDWVQYALDLPFAHKPGQHWAYNSSSLILMGEMIARDSNMKIDAFAEQYLFKPLGIKNFQWLRSPKDRAWIGGGARMIPREMAKIGLLMQRQGLWNGKRLLSEKWIEKSTHKHIERLGGVDYAYLWQTGSTLIEDKLIKAYWASGNGGQYIIILPDLDMVVVFTGGNYNSALADQPFRMLTRYILPAFHPPEHIEPVNLNQDYLESLSGIFSLDFEPSVTSTIDVYQNNLRILSPDNEYIQLVPVSKTIFKGESPLYGPLSVEFIKNIQGEIIKLTIYGSFSKYTFEKK